MILKNILKSYAGANSRFESNRTADWLNHLAALANQKLCYRYISKNPKITESNTKNILQNGW